MANRLLALITCLFFGGQACAQSDIKVMLKQIALLAVHVKELENAIDIARDGLTTIHEIKNGEFNLHNLFFSSLKSVNPAVAKYSRIAVIISDQVAIIADFKSLLQRLRTAKNITPSEIRYIESVYSHMTEECSKTLNDLITVTSNGGLEMTDDERITRIDLIYDDMQDKYSFSRQFALTADKLASEREGDYRELGLLKTLE